MDRPRMSLLLLIITATTVPISGCPNKRAERADPAKNALSAQPRAEGKPKIEAVEKEYNFGKVKQGTTLEHVFRVRNQGDRELIIEKASGS